MAKRTSATHAADKDRVIGFLLELVKKSDLSDDATAELFVDSETVIDNYQAAVQENTSNLPSCEDIGIACFWLLFLTNTFKPGIYLDLIIKFLTPCNGVSLYSSLDVVLELKQHAVSSLEQMAQPHKPPCSICDVPF